MGPNEMAELLAEAGGSLVLDALLWAWAHPGVVLGVLCLLGAMLLVWSLIRMGDEVELEGHPEADDEQYMGGPVSVKGTRLPAITRPMPPAMPTPRFGGRE